jgi:hypothetical protein
MGISNMKKHLSKVWRDVSGRLGENLLRHYLTQKEIVTEDLGKTDLPFDLTVAVPDGRVFKKKAVIQVKTETKVSKLFPRYTFLPTKEQWEDILRRKEKSKYADHELWLALLWINWQDNELQFVGCMCPEEKITDKDFRLSKKRSIFFQSIWAKSPLKFSSKTPPRYNLVKESSGQN